MDSDESKVILTFLGQKKHHLVADSAKFPMSPHLLNIQSHLYGK